MITLPEANPLLHGSLRSAVERRVSGHLGRAWAIARWEDRTSDASHAAAVLSDGRFAVFAKFGDKPFVMDQFRQEAAGLRMLAERARVLTPAVIGVERVEGVDGGAIVILEAVQSVPRAEQQWRDIGRALAMVHQVTGEHFGLATHCYWGDLRLDNTPSADWVSFYRDRRLLPWLEMANASGHLPIDLARKVEGIIPRLSDLAGAPVRPCLLHGDAHTNNYISTAQGAVLIDPAVHFGHPELDLAYLDLFMPAPSDILNGYREVGLIDAGFEQRKPLWCIAAWLGVVVIAGKKWLHKLDEAVAVYA